MQIDMQLPKAFSLRDENEFFPLQHLMARLNPDLMVVQLATGIHVNGGCTVLWGMVYLQGEPICRSDVENALEEAGFDFTHGTVHRLDFLTGQPGESEGPSRTDAASSFL